MAEQSRRPDYKPHYVYELRRISEGAGPTRYFGVRTAFSGDPHDDNYMSSSKIVNKLIEQGVEFEKTVLETFATREEANEAERRLHIEERVHENPEFYNRSIGGGARTNRMTLPRYAAYRGPDGKIYAFPKGSQPEEYGEETWQMTDDERFEFSMLEIYRSLQRRGETHKYAEIYQNSKKHHENWKRECAEAQKPCWQRKAEQEVKLKAEQENSEAVILALFIIMIAITAFSLIA